MNSSLRKITFLLLVIAVLPLLVFSLFEIGNFRQNEKVIQNIYKNQLDAILFSINQYSDDIINNFASRLESDLNSNDGSEPEKIISELPSLKVLCQYSPEIKLMRSLPVENIDTSKVNPIVRANISLLKQLETYFGTGYRKIEALEGSNEDGQYLIFITRIRDEKVINLLKINPEQFISRILDPKIQEIAKGKFHIAAYHTGQDAPFYTSDKQYNPGNIAQREPFWLLKNYQMGIELKDATIADLTRARIKRNLFLIIIIDGVFLLGAMIIFRNVRKEVELSQLKSDFVSNVSHEIRTPLALISMYVESLEMGRVRKEKTKEYYDVILKETTRLSGIVNRILNFSQIENNKRKYSFSDNNLNEIAENAGLSFRHSLESKGFRYTFSPDQSIPDSKIDREAVTDALINLVDNAVKYSNNEKEISVRTGTNEKFVYLEVEDKGIGISHKDQKYIFDKFYRVSQADLAYKVKGSGLGLAIVKHIMDSHEGKISVKSTEGKGSIFRLSFPLNKK